MACVDPNRDSDGRFVCTSGAPTHGHNQKTSATYRSWVAMRARCLNPQSTSFKYYSGRGITVDPRWDCFENFLEDMGPRPIGMTLDRKENDRGYCKENCRWATQDQQIENRRPHTRLYTFAGITLNQSEWAARIGISRAVLTRRISNGWTEKEILQPPIPFDRTRAGLKSEVYDGKLFR